MPDATTGLVEAGSATWPRARRGYASGVAKADEQSFHAFLTQLPGYEDQLAAYQFMPPRRGEPEPAYAGPFAERLAALGLSPYSHQARAFEAVGRGRNVAVATATASGKSLVFQLPVIDALARGRTSLLLYPTKALAADQLLKLRTLASAAGLASGAADGDGGLVGTYDGDTSQETRAEARERLRALLTNPDMLHYGILPHHAAWARFLGTLDYVVLDELHAYRGVLGSHVANVVRRLLRLAERYGASPSVIAASATIGNPAEHAERLAGRPFDVIADDGAPSSAREFVMWRPPRAGGGRGGAEEGAARRRSANSEAATLAAEFVRADVKSIFFCNSRKGAELVRRYAAGILGPELEGRVESYRAGYTPEARRSLEDSFRAGAITVLTSTSALELGVDIGGVDAVVLVGYPGSKMAMWQRSGRAGRAGRRALTLLIPGQDPLDEYYLTHPDALLGGPVEDAVADPFNEVLHPRHLACAAAEAPLRQEEALVAPWTRLDTVEGLVPQGDAFVSRRRYPHRRVELRGGYGKRIRLKDGFGRSLGVTDLGTALRELHPGAVHLHRGEQYLVASLDLTAGVARLLPHIEDYYTQPRSETDIEVLGPIPSRAGGPGELTAPPQGVSVGRVRVTHRVTGYVMKRFLSEAVLEERALDLPEIAYDTQALWFDAGDLPGAPGPAELPAAMHALEHTLIGLLPAFVLCERADVGGVSYPLFPATLRPTVFIYDGHPGGVGYALAGAAVFADWLAAASQLLESCPCGGGCPRCVLSPKCGNGNQFLDKEGAARLARALRARLDAMRPDLQAVDA